MAHDTVPLSNAQTRDIEALLHPYTNAATHRKVVPPPTGRSGRI
jgi:hypothetical protein